MVAEDILESLNRYWKSCTRTGYNPYEQVMKLETQIFVERTLDIFSEFVTEADYRALMKLLYSSYEGSTVLPYPDWKKAVNDKRSSLFARYRITEEGDFRSPLIRVAE